MRLYFLIFFILISNILLSQVDSSCLVKYSPEYKFKEGIFITFDQVKDNDPISKTRIITSANLNDIDYFEKVTTSKKIAFYDNNGIKQEIAVDKIWGYCRNGTLYINWNDEFNRIPVVGSICHFIADVTVVHQSNYYDPYYYSNPYHYPYRQPSYATDELRQYILDFKTGKVMNYNYTSMLVVLMNDPELYDEYNAFKKRKKKQLQFYYLRKFNERNPLYLPAK